MKTTKRLLGLILALCAIFALATTVLADEPEEPEHVHNLEHHAEVPATEHTNGMQEYWYCPDCDTYFTDAEAKYPIASKSLTILAEHSDYMEYHAEVPAGDHTKGMKAYWYCSECDTYYDAEDTEFKYPVASKDLVILPLHNDYVEYHEEVPACHENGMKAYWYCSACDTYYDGEDTELKYPVAAKSLVIPAYVELEHREEVPATEHTDGMKEHWYCPVCDTYFEDAEGKYPIAAKRLVIPSEHTVEHHDAVPACHEDGMEEYWYCVDCDVYFIDAECKYNVARKSLVIPAYIELEHHAEVPATEHTNGMHEYWYCHVCDTYFTDAEGKYNIASKSLTILAEHADHMEYHAEVPAGEHTKGMQAYWYCSECDSYFAADDTETPVASKSLTILPEHNDYMTYHAEVPATATENGMKAYWYCSLCDTYYAADDTEFKYPIASKTLVIPATGETGDSDIPKTGDSFSVVLVSALILVSGMGVAALTVSKKKFF